MKIESNELAFLSAVMIGSVISASVTALVLFDLKAALKKKEASLGSRRSRLIFSPGLFQY